MIGPQILDRALNAGVAATEASLTQFTPQAHRCQAGIAAQPLAQVGQEGVSGFRPRRARTVGRRLKAEGDVFAHRLAVDAELAGDGGRAQPLPVQFHNHDEFPKSNHRIAPTSPESSIGENGSGAWPG